MLWDVFLCLFIAAVTFVPVSMVADRYTAREARLLRIAYGVHLVMVAVNMAVVKFIYRRGDMYSFYFESGPVAGWVRDEPGLLWDLILQMFGLSHTLQLGGSQGTHMMVGFATFSRLIFGSSFAAMSLAPALIGYFAKVMLFDVFRDSFGRSHRRYVLFCFLFLPSTVFWTAGLIKETVAISSIAFTLFGIDRVVRGRLWALPILFIGLAVLQHIKGHFLITLVVGGAAALYVWRASRSGEVTIRPITFLIVLGLGFAGVVLAGKVAPRFALENIAQEAVFLQTRSAGGSQIDIGVDRHTSTSQLVMLAPIAMFTGLYRPLIFESGSVTMIVNSLETTALALLTVRGLFRSGLRGMFLIAIRSPAFTFMFVFAVLSAVGIGVATGNLGTLSRYRAPIMPFFALMLTVLDARALPASVAAAPVQQKKKKRRVLGGRRARPTRPFIGPAK